MNEGNTDKPSFSPNGPQEENVKRTITIESTSYPPRSFTLNPDDFLIVDPPSNYFMVCLVDEKAWPETYVYPFDTITQLTTGTSAPTPTLNINPAINLLKDSKKLV